MNEDSTAHPDFIKIIRSGDGLLKKLFASLSPETRRALLSHATLRDVAVGTVIIENGATSGEVGYVIDGVLAMIQEVDHVRRHIVGLLVPTDVYGRLFDGPTTYRIEALAATRILAFPRDPFERVMRQHPEAERLFLVHLLDEMDAAREWLLLISGRKVINRIAAFLMVLARRSRSAGGPDPVKLRLPLSRKDLAHYLGTRKETLSRVFHELQQKGILRIINPETFEVLDMDGLTDISGDDLTVEEAG